MSKQHSNVFRRRALTCAISAVLSGYQVTGYGQTADEEADDGSGSESRGVIEELVVTGRQTERSISSIPNSISVIDQEELTSQVTIDNSLASLLQFSVPGMAAQQTSIQTPARLRGRTALILIDGVPQNQLLRSSGYDVLTISPYAIERVEVMRGANAVFGFGATGGVINFITKRPVDEGYEAGAVLRTAFQLDEAEPSREIYVHGSGRFGAVGVLVGASFEDRQEQSDGDGNLIANFNSEAGRDIRNIHAAIDWDINEEQRLLATLNDYTRKSVLENFTVIDEPGDPNAGVLSTARFADFFFTDFDPIYYGSPEIDPSTLPFELGPEEMSFTNATLTYQHDNLLGSVASFTALWHEYPATFAWSRFNARISQLVRLRERSGVRVNADSPLDFGGALPEGSRLSWGFDYVSNTVDEARVVFVGDEFVYPTRTTGRTIPFTEQDTTGAYLQFEVPLGSFLVSGGARYESYDIDMYDNIAPDGTPSFLGGKIEYDSDVYNLGVVYYARPNLDLYASWSQGLDVTQVGRAANQVSLASEIDPQPAVTDSYEVGARFVESGFRLEVAGFFADSELASRTTPVPGGGLAIPLRQPEEIWGIEASWSYEASDSLSFGGIFSWIEGDRELTDGTTAPLQRRLLSPTMIAAYGDWVPRPWLSGRLQIWHAFASDEFEAPSADFENQTLVDLLVAFKSERYGQLEIGIDNLLDEVYVAQGNRVLGFAGAYYPIPGRTLSLTYRFSPNWE